MIVAAWSPGNHRVDTGIATEMITGDADDTLRWSAVRTRFLRLATENPIDGKHLWQRRQVVSAGAMSSSVALAQPATSAGYASSVAHTMSMTVMVHCRG
ncbi:MAG: hypothetical protein R2853_03245 [Thermomicrobiales bacterium]